MPIPAVSSTETVTQLKPKRVAKGLPFSMSRDQGEGESREKNKKWSCYFHSSFIYFTMSIKQDRGKWGRGVGRATFSDNKKKIKRVKNKI